MRWPLRVSIFALAVLFAFVPPPATAAPHQQPEPFKQSYRRFYIRPRAYPDSVLDPKARMTAWAQLQALRDSLHQPYIPPPGFLRGMPIMFAGTQPCTWTSIGPTNVNGRVTGIAIDPTNRQRMFVSTVGGIWRSTDRGNSWQRVSDRAKPGTRPIRAGRFGAVAINPANPNEVFAGGGDPNRFDAATGGGPGLWRSTTGGGPDTWEHEGPVDLDPAIIFRIRVGPASQNDVYVASSVGVWKRDHTSGAWTRLSMEACSDVVVDFAQSPAVVYAGVYDPPSERGIKKFANGQWQRVWSSTSGSGAIALAMANSAPLTIYAKIEDGTGLLKGFYVTNNGGATWTRRVSSSALDDSYDYTWFNNVVEVDPNDPNKVYVGGVRLYRATNAGLTPPSGTANGSAIWKDMSRNPDQTHYYNPSRIHDDQHAIAIDPVDSQTLWVGNDGGLDFAENTSGNAWHWVDRAHGMTITEFYAITAQRGMPTAVAGGSQDNGTEVTYGNRSWYPFPNCDANDVALDAPGSSALYQGCFLPTLNVVAMTNPVAGTADGGYALPWPSTSEVPCPPVAADPRLAGLALAARCEASTPPTVVETHDGLSWLPASPSLPANSEITCLAIAATCATPLPEHICSYYVGFVDATGATPPKIWSLQDAGATWIQNPQGLPTNLSPNGIAVDPTNPKRAFAAFGGSAGGRVMVTSDGGQHWAELTPAPSTLPLPAAPVIGVALDPNQPQVVYVATNVGMYRGMVPINGTSVTWFPFDAGLPNGVDVTDLAVNAATGTLTISTMGYGAWEIDIRQGATCPQISLTIRDNVFDRGVGDAPFAVPDPEHPVRDTARPGFFKPDHDLAGLLYWWTSSDIRIEVPVRTPVQNKVADVDHVAMESCPTEATRCPTGSLNCPDCPNGTIFDQDPRAGEDARVYVQVTNRGTTQATDLRVIALWTDASAGLPSLPVDFWSSVFPATGPICGLASAPSAWQVVDGCRRIATLEAGEAKVLAFSWHVPLNAAEHSCMMALVRSPDDPIALGPSALDPVELVPHNHQIGLRNLHVVDGIKGSLRVRGFEGLKVYNASADTTGIALLLSRNGMPPGARLGLLLPPAAGKVDLANVVRRAARLDSAQISRAIQLGLSPDSMYSFERPGASIRGLKVPPDSLWQVGVLYDTGANQRPNTAKRFTVLARQGHRILGGSTYVLRVR